METGIHSDFFSIDKGRFEWAGNHVTGVTEDGLMDIVWGEEASLRFGWMLQFSLNITALSLFIAM